MSCGCWLTSFSRSSFLLYNDIIELSECMGSDATEGTRLSAWKSRSNDFWCVGVRSYTCTIFRYRSVLLRFSLLWCRVYLYGRPHIGDSDTLCQLRSPTFEWKTIFFRIIFSFHALQPSLNADRFLFSISHKKLPFGSSYWGTKRPGVLFLGCELPTAHKTPLIVRWVALFRQGN